MTSRKSWDSHAALWKKDFEFYPLENKKDNILQWLKTLPRRKILDQGCGIGQWTITLSKLGFKPTGLDYSEKLIQAAKKNAKKHKANCKFIQADIRNLPFKPQSFNAVLSAGILEHVPETEQCIKEISRILKPKGHLIIHIPHKISMFTINKLLQKALGIWKAGYEKSFTKPQVRKLLKQHNFKILKQYTNPIEPTSKITKILHTLDWPLYKLNLGGHHFSLLCQKH